MKLNATIKGIITGVLMVVVGILLYFTNVSSTSGLQYIGYLIYGAGIVWSIVAYSKTKGSVVKFGELFGQGFRCFVVVTLIMALFTLIFYKINTKLIEEKAALTKQELLKTEKNRTPQEIDGMIENGKKNFPIMAASAAIFQYLLIGAIVSMSTAGSLYLQRKKQ